MGKKTAFATAMLFAMGSMGTCLASQKPSNSDILNLSLADTSGYVSVSSSPNENKILLVAKDVVKIKDKLPKDKEPKEPKEPKIKDKIKEKIK